MDIVSNFELYMHKHPIYIQVAQLVTKQHAHSTVEFTYIVRKTNQVWTVDILGTQDHKHPRVHATLQKVQR